MNILDKIKKLREKPEPEKEERITEGKAIKNEGEEHENFFEFVENHPGTTVFYPDGSWSGCDPDEGRSVRIG